MLFCQKISGLNVCHVNQLSTYSNSCELEIYIQTKRLILTGKLTDEELKTSSRKPLVSQSLFETKQEKSTRHEVSP